MSPAFEKREAVSDVISCFCSRFRDFIEEGVVDYAKKNPSTVVYVSPQTCRIPKIVAEYCKCSQCCSHGTSWMVPTSSLTNRIYFSGPKQIRNGDRAQCVMMCMP